MSCDDLRLGNLRNKSQDIDNKKNTVRDISKPNNINISSSNILNRINVVD